MAWRFRARKVLRFGPIFVNLASGGQRGYRPRFTSWGIQLGPFRRNFTTGTDTIDTPGPGSIRRKQGGRGR